MTRPGQEPPGMRLTVDVATFGAWRAATPGLAVPDEFGVELPEPVAAQPEPDGTGVSGVPVPPFVAASFAVHAAAEVAVCLRVDDGAVRLLLCLSVADDLAAVLVRAARSVPSGAGAGWAPGGWVQVALAPADLVVPEVLSWVPEPDAVQPLTGGSVQLLVVGADDAGLAELASWVERDGAWRRLSPQPDGSVALLPALRRELGADLAAALAAALVARRERPDGR